MGRVDPETFADRELSRVLVAGSLTEALQVEELLTQWSVDYLVEVEPFATTLFGSVRHGAVFYVAEGDAAYCRSQLAAAGFRRVVHEESRT